MLKRQRLTRQLLPGQHAPKHNSEEGNSCRLDNSNGFCSPFIKCTVTSKIRSYYRDSYARKFYLDQKAFTHQPGLAKTRED
jgi:hypothetical protein